MPPPRRFLLPLLLVTAIAGSCTSQTSPEPTPSTAPEGGGTLRVGLLSGDDGLEFTWCPLLLCGKTLDPQSTSFADVFELDRCCLMRTLLSYEGSSVGDGGTILRPDLAKSLPTISSDGLTWTFHLRSGILYGPPFEDKEIVAADLIRSIERAFTPAGPAIPWANGGTIGGYYTDTYLPDVIAGAREFIDRKAEHVSGLQAPDPHTLVVHLTQPTGDLGQRLAFPQLGPIPANPARPGDPLGVAQGHDFDYGLVMVSSGPYMFEGSDEISFDGPPEDVRPPSGNGWTKATLVRNPSWSPASDPIRAAWPDRIEFYRVDSAGQAEQLVRSGAIDLVLNWAADAGTTGRWLDEPDLRHRITVAPADFERNLGLNLAVPPFDDLHVRRAVNLVVDRRAVASALEDRGRGMTQQIFTHLALDAYEDNLLLSYAPPQVGPTSEVEAAQDEMKLSGYDADHDGRCDAPECSGLQLLVDRSYPADVIAAEEITSRLRAIGLDVHAHDVGHDAFNASYHHPSLHVALRLDNWGKDYPSATSFLPVLLGSGAVGEASIAMVGATPDQLERYGYSVRSVPDVDGRLAACQDSAFEAQLRCWAQLDQYLSEQLVPWVPLTQLTQGWLHSSRVQQFNIDASIFVPLPALDHILVHGESPSPAPTPPAPSPVPSIPEGIYRVTVSLSDIVEAGGGKDDVEDTGTFTIELRDGRFMWHQRGTNAIFDPIAVGRYEGEGERVRFHVDQPYYNAADLSSLAWRVDGASLAFQLSRCTGKAAHDRFFCGFQKALFAAHPWERLE